MADHVLHRLTGDVEESRGAAAIALGERERLANHRVSNALLNRSDRQVAHASLHERCQLRFAVLGVADRRLELFKRYGLLQVRTDAVFREAKGLFRRRDATERNLDRSRQYPLGGFQYRKPGRVRKADIEDDQIGGRPQQGDRLSGRAGLEDLQAPARREPGDPPALVDVVLHDENSVELSAQPLHWN